MRKFQPVISHQVDHSDTTRLGAANAGRTRKQGVLRGTVNLVAIAFPDPAVLSPILTYLEIFNLQVRESGIDFSSGQHDGNRKPLVRRRRLGS